MDNGVSENVCRTLDHVGLERVPTEHGLVVARDVQSGARQLWPEGQDALCPQLREETARVVGSRCWCARWQARLHDLLTGVGRIHDTRCRGPRAATATRSRRCPGGPRPPRPRRRVTRGEPEQSLEPRSANRRACAAFRMAPATMSRVSDESSRHPSESLGSARRRVTHRLTRSLSGSSTAFSRSRILAPADVALGFVLA